MCNGAVNHYSKYHGPWIFSWSISNFVACENSIYAEGLADNLLTHVKYTIESCICQSNPTWEVYQLTRQGKSGRKQANTPLDSRALPTAQSSDSSFEDEARRAAWRANRECQHNDNREHNVRNTANNLKSLEDLCADNVANNWDCQNCPPE